MATYYLTGRDKSGAAVRVPVQARSAYLAMEAGRMQGIAVEKVNDTLAEKVVQTPVQANPVNYATVGLKPKKRRELGLSKGEAWVLGIMGLLTIPALIGIPLIIWAALSHQRHKESA